MDKLKIFFNLTFFKSENNFSVDSWVQVDASTHFCKLNINTVKRSNYDGR